MYISRILISHSDQLRYRIIDDYSIHQYVYSLFPEYKYRSFLYYVDYSDDQYLRIIIQSETEPGSDNRGICEIKEIPNGFFDYEEYLFKIRLNPVTRSSGKVISVKSNEDFISDYLMRRQEELGVNICLSTISITGKGIMKMRKNKENRLISLAYVDVSGVLRVKDKTKFIMNARKGIGREKGFGFGLFQLKPIIK